MCREQLVQVLVHHAPSCVLTVGVVDTRDRYTTIIIAIIIRYARDYDSFEFASQPAIIGGVDASTERTSDSSRRWQ